MRTLVDIPDMQLNELTTIAALSKTSRAEVIRQAVAAYIAAHRPSTNDAFGIWKAKGEDGMAYQEKVRAEW